MQRGKMSNFRSEINNILYRLQKGDTSLQEILFTKTYNHLKIIAFKYTNNKNNVEDVLIDAYERIFQYIYTFNRLKNGYNWMCKIVQNVAFDYNEGSNAPLVVENYNEIFGKYVEELDDKCALMQELARLDIHDQEMLYLKYWNDFTYRQIAKKLKMSKSAVHRRVLELIDILRNKLQ